MSTAFIPLCNNGYYLGHLLHAVFLWAIIITFILWLKQNKKQKRERERPDNTVFLISPQKLSLVNLS